MKKHARANKKKKERRNERRAEERGQEGSHCCQREEKERRMEAGYSITATRRKARAEVGEEE